MRYLFLLALAGCAGKPPPPVPIPERLAAKLAESELAFAGEITAVEKSPGAWSGLLAIHQDVHYRVTRVIKGDAGVGQMVTVGYLLVASSPTADPKVPKLREDLFRPGAKLIVLARREQGRWTALNECDVADPALVEALVARARK